MIYFKNINFEKRIDKISSVGTVNLFTENNTLTLRIWFSEDEFCTIEFEALEKAREFMTDIYSCIKRGYGVIDFNDYQKGD